MLLLPGVSAAAAAPGKGRPGWDLVVAEHPGRPTVGDIVRVVGGPGKGRTARITVDATPFALGTLYAH